MNYVSQSGQIRYRISEKVNELFTWTQFEVSTVHFINGEKERSSEKSKATQEYWQF